MPNVLKLAEIYQQFMDELGIPRSIHSEDTAMRVAKMWVNELTKGLNEVDFVFTTFPANGNRRKVVVQKDIEFYSICAHHHIPFFGTVDFAYMIDEKVVGLSKIPRLVKHLSRKPTVQEDLGNEIVRVFERKVKPLAIAVRIKAKHLCMSMRGIENQGAYTITEHDFGECVDDVKAVRMALKE